MLHANAITSFDSPSGNDAEKKREKKTKIVAQRFALHSTAEKERKIEDYLTEKYSVVFL